MFAKTFRNSLLASSLLIGASLLVGPAAMAEPSGGEVSGTVAPISTVTFTPTTETAITAGDAVAAYPMGTLAIQNNSNAGWTLDVRSANGGELRNVVGETTYKIEYTNLTSAPVDGATITPVTFASAITDIELIDAVYDNAVAAGVSNVAVTAAIAADQHVPAGTYTDTVTFTLTSK